MNYISFSLWGREKLYTQGAIENAKLIPSIYPGWKMVVFYSQDVDSSVIDNLSNLDCLCIPADESYYGMFWRYFACELEDVDYVIFRDADSRINSREKSAVQEWIDSGKSSHCIRDHPLHRIPSGCSGPSFMGGCWGIFAKSYDLVSRIKSSYLAKHFAYGSDQTFLQEVYSYFHSNGNIFIHDEFGVGNVIKYPRKNYFFIGERINYDNTRLTSDWTIIRDFKHEL